MYDLVSVNNVKSKSIQPQDTFLNLSSRDCMVLLFFNVVVARPLFSITGHVSEAGMLPIVAKYLL